MASIAITVLRPFTWKGRAYDIGPAMASAVDALVFQHRRWARLGHAGDRALLTSDPVPLSMSAESVLMMDPPKRRRGRPKKTAIDVPSEHEPNEALDDESIADD